MIVVFIETVRTSSNLAVDLPPAPTRHYSALEAFNAVDFQKRSLLRDIQSAAITCYYCCGTGDGNVFV